MRPGPNLRLVRLVSGMSSLERQEKTETSGRAVGSDVRVVDRRRRQYREGRTAGFLAKCLFVETKEANNSYYYYYYYYVNDLVRL